MQAMPGGLAMTVDPDRAVALSAPDGHTRDVWVVSDAEQGPHVSLWRPTLETARVERSQRVIQSRVADDLFWLGRYSERADWTMRVLRSALRRVEEDSGPATAGARRASASKSCSPRSAPAAAPTERQRRRRYRNRAAVRAADLRDARAIARSNARSKASTASPIWRATACRSRPGRRCSKFRPGDTWATALATAHARCGARSARGRPRVARRLQRPDAREHDPQFRLVVPGYGAAPGARLQPERSDPDAVHSRAGSRRRRRAACCCCSSSPTASSPTARATGSIRCWRWCSICCCSTKPIRAVSRLSARRHLAAPGGPARCPARRRACRKIAASSWRC